MNLRTKRQICISVPRFSPVLKCFSFTDAGKSQSSAPAIHVDRSNTGVICGIMQLNGKERFTGYYYCSFAPVANLLFPIEAASDGESNHFWSVSLSIRIKLLGWKVRLKELGNCLNKLKLLLILKPFRNVSCILPIFSLIWVTHLLGFKREMSCWQWWGLSRS